MSKNEINGPSRRSSCARERCGCMRVCHDSSPCLYNLLHVTARTIASAVMIDERDAIVTALTVSTLVYFNV